MSTARLGTTRSTLAAPVAIRSASAVRAHRAPSGSAMRVAIASEMPLMARCCPSISSQSPPCCAKYVAICSITVFPIVVAGVV